MMHFKRVIIVNPLSPSGFVSNKDSMGGFGQLYPLGAPPFPPMDMVYLAGYLAEKKIPIDILECVGLSLTKEQFLEKINKLCKSESKEPILIIVRTSAPTLDWDLSLCKEIKEKIVSISICIYGPVIPHVVWRVKKENFVNYIIKGEPDETIYELVTGCPETNIKDLIFRNNGNWTENPPRTLIDDLDKLPFPKWELFPYARYILPKSSTTSKMPFLPMLTSRGCPLGCNYCPYPVGQGSNWRYRSPKNVVDEIEYLINLFEIKYIIFRDPIFTLNQKRVIEICKEIENRKLHFKWKCETRLDCVNEETLRAMARAGCEGINCGIESAEIEVQTNVGRKPITKEKVIQTVALCRKLGIKTFCFFIIGLPGDTTKTIFESISFAINLRPNWIQFTAASPFIGTKLREWAVSKGLVVDDKFAYINCHEVMMGNENLSKEQILSLLHLAQFIQNYLINRRGILKNENRTDLFYRCMKSFADFISYYFAQVVFAFGKKRLGKRFA